MSTCLATAPDGCRIAQAIAPSLPGAPRMALLHSLALGRAFWNAVIAKAGAVRNAGAGLPGARASGGTGQFKVAMMAEDPAAVLDHAGWDRAP